MTIWLVQVYVLELAGSRQDNISIASSIGLEKFMHNGKQLVAHQALDNFAGIRCRGHRVGVVDKERVDRRVGFTRQDSSQPIHIQGAWCWRADLFTLMSYG